MALKDGFGVETLAGIGMVSIAASIVIGSFVSIEVGDFSVSAFAEGLLSGVGLVLVFFALLRRRRG